MSSDRMLASGTPEPAYCTFHLLLASISRPKCCISSKVHLADDTVRQHGAVVGDGLQRERRAHHGWQNRGRTQCNAGKRRGARTPPSKDNVVSWLLAQALVSVSWVCSRCTVEYVAGPPRQSIEIGDSEEVCGYLCWPTSGCGQKTSHTQVVQKCGSIAVKVYIFVSDNLSAHLVYSMYSMSTVYG